MKYEFKGTKGEWHAVEFAGFWEITDAPFYDSKRIMTYDDDIFGSCATVTQAEANAHLCAAAPDLLQACIDFVEKVERGEAKSTKSYNQMKQAINKALNINI